MSKQNQLVGKAAKIIYWIATIWLSLGMVSTGVVQLIQMKEETDMMTRLGYPLYLLTILGIWKILGVVAVLVPRFPLLKEWAYAGLTFDLLGAVYSNIMTDGFQIGLFVLVPVFVVAIVSYIYNQKMYSNRPK